MLDKTLRHDEADWTEMDDPERSDDFNLMHDGERGRSRSDSFDLTASLPGPGLCVSRHQSLRVIVRQTSKALRESTKCPTHMVADTFALDEADDESDEDTICGLPDRRKSLFVEAKPSRRHSVFAPKTLETLEAAKPGMSAWLATSKGLLIQLALILCFMILDVARPLLYNFATMHLSFDDKPIPGVLTGAKNVLAISLSMSLSIANDGREGFRNCIPSMETVKLIPVASLSTAANVLSIFALDHIDAGTFKLLMQMGLPTTAFLSFLIMGRRYTSLQLQSLFFALVSTSTFFVAWGAAKSKGDNKEENQKSMQDLLLGGMWTAACFVCTSSSAVLGERFLTRDKRPYNAQKVQMEIAGVPMSAVALLTHKSMYQGYPRGVFVGWSWRVEIALVEWVLAGWLTGFIIKHFSALVKRLLQGGAAIVTYIISVFAFGLEPTLLVNLNAVMVVQAIMLFFTSPAPPKDVAAPAPAVTSVQLAAKYPEESCSAGNEESSK